MTKLTLQEVAYRLRDAGVVDEPDNEMLENLVRTWRKRGHLPPEDTHVLGRPLWNPSTIDRAIRTGSVGSRMVRETA